jgi:hypothetical protein
MHIKALKFLEAQVDKLEAARPGTSLPYVIRVSSPPTDLERLQIKANAEAGRPFVLLPHRCTSIEEWVARYRPSKVAG